MSPDEKALSLSLAGVDVPVEKASSSPCAVACPAGVSVKSYVTLIAAGRFREALEVVRAHNPFPGNCGRGRRRFPAPRPATSHRACTNESENQSKATADQGRNTRLR